MENDKTTIKIIMEDEKMGKKLLAIILSTVLVFSEVGCSANEKKSRI